MLDKRIGQQLGNYRLTRLLGEGGFAKVYLAEHIHLRTFVAIKILDTTVTDEAEMDFFLNEAQKLTSLQHPHIVKIIDSGVQGNIPYLVMQYAPNGTLAQKHRDKLPLPLPTIALYVKQITSALQYVHEQGLVHCDVKPANLLLGPNDEVILGDFGIITPTRTTAAPTMEHIRGTVPYMAPEHSAGRPVRVSDQYSLGIIVYEWLSGLSPFQGTPEAIYQQHLSAVPPPLRRKDTGSRIPLSIERVVMKTLEKNPKNRYPHIQDFANALESAIRATQAFPRSTNPLYDQKSGDEALILQSSGYNGAPDDLTQRDSPPKLPVHPLIRRQFEILQRFQALQSVHEREKGELWQQHTEKINALSQHKEQLLATAVQGQQRINQPINSLYTLLQEWTGLIHASTRLMVSLHLLKSSAPPQITPSTEYVQKMEAYEFRFDKLRQRINPFLGFYKRPQNLIYVWAAVAIVLTLALLLSTHLRVDNIGGIFLALLSFLILLLLSLYPQLFFLDKACIDMQQLERTVEREYEQQCNTVENTYELYASQLQRKYEKDIAQLEQRLQQQVSEPLSAFTLLMHELGYAGVEWANQQQWDQWKPAQGTQAPVTRIGSFTFNAPTGLPDFPALVPCPFGGNIIYQVEGIAKDEAISAVQALILRLLATHPPGKVHFTFFDPDKLGGNVNAFLSLPGSDSFLGTERAWYHNQDIKQQLRKLIDHIAHTKNVASIIENYHVLVVMDFPAKFTPEAADDLLRIARNGPQSGVSTVVVVDTAQALGTFDQQLQALEKVATVITWNGESQQFSWQDSLFQGSQLRLDAAPPLDSPPPQDLFKHILREVSCEAQAANSIERQFFNAETKAGRVLDSSNRGKLVLGHSTSGNEPVTITFRRRSDSNLLIIGKEEEAALDLLTIAMLDRATYHPPTHVQFYAIDLSLENAIEKYTSSAFELLRQSLPHYFPRPVVELRGMRDELPRLLTAIGDELEERKDGTGTTSTLYLFFHGLQFAEKLLQKGPVLGENTGSRDAAQNFSYIVRKGSRMGIHTLIWSDKCNSLETSLGNEALYCFDYRLALPMSSREDVAKVLERSEAGAPGQKQAFFFSRDKDGFEKFHPYSVPSQGWLQSTIAKIQQQDFSRQG